MKRLTALAHELAADGVVVRAGAKAHAEVHKVLDAAQARYADKIAASRKAVLTVEGTSLTADLKGGRKTFENFWEDADYAVIEDAYRRASRLLSADVARTYAEVLAERNRNTDSREEALMEAHADIAALGLVPEVKAYLDIEADSLAESWLAEHRVSLKALADDRQEVYKQIRRMSAKPQDIELARPRSSMEMTTAREQDGTETALPVRRNHLLCDENGDFPITFHDNSWEMEVLDTELRRTAFVAWYRNPSRSSDDSLGIAYYEGNSAKLLRPDFIFFTERAGAVEAVIVDPHGHHLSDALPKLRGLAQYAEDHAADYQRIESVSKVGDRLRVLDIKEETVRAAIASAQDAKGLYEGPYATNY